MLNEGSARGVLKTPLIDFNDENEPMLIIGKSLSEPIHAFEKNVRNCTYRLESTSDCHLANN